MAALLGSLLAQERRADQLPADVAKRLRGYPHRRRLDQRQPGQFRTAVERQGGEDPPAQV